MAASAFAFDLDGTLWDSYPCYAAALEAGRFLPRLEAVKRLKSGENIIAIGRELRMTNTELARLCLGAVGCIRLYHGVAEGLTALSERGVAMGVVTNLPRWLIRPILCELDLERYFKVSVFAARKPAPRGLLSAVECLGGTNGAMYYLGDMETDAEAARRANVPFAWAAYGYGVHRPNDVAALIRRFDEVLVL
jgi:HAD superfamily hydrolase (TIGR01549 family)